MSKLHPSTGQEPGSGPSGSGNDAPSDNKRVAYAVGFLILFLIGLAAANHYGWF